jgi:3-phenylpropionate/trans-cinnamate dioxygenase ferredoxin reductase subunit
MTDVVIVGGGQAGCQVAASLREEGFAGNIVMIGAEEHLPYQRPPLSKAHLAGSVTRERLFLRAQSWFAEAGVELHRGRSVESIDRAARKIRLSDGEVMGYDVLVLATGGRHREIVLPGRDLAGVLSLRTLAEAEAMRERLEAAGHVVVVGGGFIGLEVAATTAAMGRTTTVLELAPRLMGRVLSAATAEFVLQSHRTRGVRVELSASVTELLGTAGQVTAVATTTGEQLPADLVVLGVGALAEDALAGAAGLAIGNGILVDEFLRTSDAAVYAVGDCARAPSRWAGGSAVRLESVQNAVEQARCAARDIVGRSEPYCAVPWFWSDQGDVKLQIAGLTQGHDMTVTVGAVDQGAFSVWCFAGGRLVGVESVNQVKEHLTARKILAAGVAVGPETVGEAGFSAKSLLAF